MRRPVPDRPRRAGTAGQATAEWIAVVVAVTLLLVAVGAALSAELPGRIAGRLLASLRGSTAGEGPREPSAATLTFVQRAVAAREGGPRPSLLSARALLRAELGEREGRRLFDHLLVEQLKEAQPEWFTVQRLPVPGTSVRGIHLGAGVRTTRSLGPPVVHVVTPSEEDEVTTGGVGESLVAWVAKVVQDEPMTRLGKAINEDLSRGGFGRLPKGVVGVAPSVVGAMQIALTEARMGWPGVGETAGDALLCMPVWVSTRRGTHTHGRAGIRTAVVRDGKMLVDAVSTADDSCDRLRR